MVLTVNRRFTLVQPDFLRVAVVLLKPANTTMEKFVPNPKLKLRGQLREVMRFKHFSIRTEQAYWIWIRGFIQFHRKSSQGRSGTHPYQSWKKDVVARPHPGPLPKVESAQEIFFVFISVDS